MLTHKNKKFVENIVNKKICIVGPATSLLGTKVGNNIDEFDCVIRTNSAPFQDSSMFIDYGCNTDIVYVNNSFLKRAVSPKDTTKEKRIRNLLKMLLSFEQKNIKYVVVKGVETARMIKSAIITYNKIKQKNIKLDVTTSSRHFMEPRYKKIWAKSKKGMFEPTLASYMISDIIKLKPKLLYVTGMDFYSNATHWAGDYNQELSQKKEELIRRKNHHLIADIEFIKLIKDSCQFFKCDPVMSHFLQ